MANKEPAASFQLFNLETMSGVTSGIRTAIFQRVKLQSQTGEIRWARLLWYEDPPSCAIYLQDGENEQWSDIPLLSFSASTQEGVDAGLSWLHEIYSLLNQKEWQLRSCGSCQFWQPHAAVTVDDLPVGGCHYHAIPREIPDILIQQSGLALDCDRWLAREGAIPESENGVKTTERPLEKFAEQAVTRPTLKQRFQRFFSRNQTPVTIKTWQEKLVERSGVGAGTEPCLACQGRIANLGALTVATPDDDKQTYSVWRCRNCYTLYLNDWIDRWERADNLETEESYYRLAPADAAYILQIFHEIPGAEHPTGRHQRTEQRVWLIKFLADHTPVSHQIRRGR